MTMKKTVSLILAIVMILSCATIFSSCKKDKAEDIPMTKRTHVYSEAPLNIETEDKIEFVSNIFTDGENIIMNYDVSHTIVRDENGEEVERLDGTYYDVSGGDIVVPNPILYGSAEDLLPSAVPVIGLEENDEELNEIENIDETPVSNDVIDIMPIPDGEYTPFEIEGEPDEFGVITDEFMNIKVPENWSVENVTENVFAILPLEGGEVRRVTIDFDIPTEEDEFGYASSMFMGNDGFIRVLYSVNRFDENTFMSDNKYYILKVDLESGKVIDQKLINDCFAAAGIPGTDVYLYNVAMGGDGNYYFHIDGSDIFVVDEDMKFVKKLNAGDGFVNMFTQVGDRIIVSLSDPTYANMSYMYIENGQIMPIENSDAMNTYISDVIGGSGDRIYFKQGMGVWYYDMATSEIGEELNFLNSDIDYLNMSNLIMLEDGKMLMASNNWDEISSTTEFNILTRVPEEELKEEVIVTVGSIWADYNLIEAIMAYNKQSNGVRISLKTYEAYNSTENEDGAQTQMNNEIIAGTLPDVICLDSSLPVQSYFKKGVFIDLNKYLDDSEKGINRADYLDNILRAGETDGKLYSLITTYFISTLAAKTKYVGDKSGWTFEKMIETINNMPEGMEAFFGIGREYILDSFLSSSMSSLVNWDTGSTKFDSKEFSDFITYLAKCPEKGIYEDLYEGMPEGEYDEEAEREVEEKMQLRFWNDTCLFSDASFGSFDSVQYVYNNFASKDITFIGYPTSDENGNGAVIVPAREMAISSKSKVKDQAWDFLKYLLDEEDNMWQFSLNRKHIDEMEEYALNEMNDPEIIGTFFEPDYEWMKEMGYSEDYINFSKNSNIKLDKEMTGVVRDLVENASVIQRSDPELFDLIKEELSAFFAGTKTAEDTVRVIAGRAKTYIGERS